MIKDIEKVMKQLKTQGKARVTVDYEALQDELTQRGYITYIENGYLILLYELGVDGE